MSYQRIDRISEEVRREVDAIIREEVNDPRVSGTFSVTRAEVTRDPSLCENLHQRPGGGQAGTHDEGAQERRGVYPPGAGQADADPVTARR